jgi:hypothetical protein
MDAIIYIVPLSSCSSTPLELIIIFNIDVNSRYEIAANNDLMVGM